LEIKIQIISLGAPLKKKWKFNDFTDKALDEIKALGATIFGIQGPTSCIGGDYTN
jgi:hypothetical protein